jgi:hypothetical protein
MGFTPLPLHTTPWLLLLLTTFCASYTNNYLRGDNAFGVKLPETDVRNNSFAFLVADFGLPPPGTAGPAPQTVGECCQTNVADLMRAKRTALEATGKSLLFVAASGDNFYHSGLLDKDKGGALQWERWSSVYTNLSDVPWFAAFGNHDLGDSDLFATCPDKAARVNISGQAYASNQLDSDKGGYRPPGAGIANYHLPDFNYRTTLDALNFELIVVDQNYHDVSGIGGNPSTHTRVDAACGGGEAGLSARLTEIGHSGEALLATAAASGAKDPAHTRNVLVLQHYQGLCASLKAKFMAGLPAGEHLDFKCNFGHVHNTTCEQTGADGSCDFAMTGGGGGCCAHDVTNSQAGFGLLTFNPSGGMHIELVRLGHNCSLQPNGPLGWYS